MTVEKHFDTDLKTIPQETRQMIYLNRQCTSKCGCTYQNISPNIVRFEKVPEIGYELPFD
jgi:hypothetical protein